MPFRVRQPVHEPERERDEKQCSDQHGVPRLERHLLAALIADFGVKARGHALGERPEKLVVLLRAGGLFRRELPHELELRFAVLDAGAVLRLLQFHGDDGWYTE